MTADDGTGYEGGDMVQRMTVHDINNNSPTFKLPPLWLIMSGCGNQFLDLGLNIDLKNIFKKTDFEKLVFRGIRKNVLMEHLKSMYSQNSDQETVLFSVFIRIVF